MEEKNLEDDSSSSDKKDPTEEIIPTVDNEKFEELRHRKKSSALQPGQI